MLYNGLVKVTSVGVPHYLKPQPNYCKWKIFSTADTVLTLNFDRDRSIVNGDTGKDAEHPAKLHENRNGTF